MMRQDEKIAVGALLSVVLLVVLSVAGWVMNIFHLVFHYAEDTTIEIVLRVAGIPFAPLGALMGWFA